MLFIHDYDVKAIVKDLSQYINLSGITVSVVITDDYYMKKREITDPFHIDILTDHMNIYMNGQHADNEFAITEDYKGWFYNLIYGLYYGMLHIFLDNQTWYLDRLTKGILKLLPENYLDQFEVNKIGDKNEG